MPDNPVPPADPVAATTAVYDADPARFAAGWDAVTPTADTTDLVAWTVDGLPAGAHVLDVGAGSGRDLARLSGAGMHAVGVDVSEGLAAIAAAHGTVLVADVRSLPLPDASVDAVLASASLLHLPADDAAAAVAEIARVLQPGGRLVCSVKAGTGEAVDAAGRYFRFYDDAALDGLLTAGGFTVVRAATDGDTSRAGLAWLSRLAVRT